MIIALIISHVFALAVGVLLGAWRTAPEGEETAEGFVEGHAMSNTLLRVRNPRQAAR